jgi:hypothetical protein
MQPQQLAPALGSERLLRRCRIDDECPSFEAILRRSGSIPLQRLARGPRAGRSTPFKEPPRVLHRELVDVVV